MTKLKNRVVYFDLLNIVACFCVLCMHSNGNAHTYTATLAWKQAMIVETLAYWAVPVFFMLSGATLMCYREKYTTSEFFKKRLLRIFIPYLIWSVISAIFNHYTPFDIGLRGFAEKLLFGSADNIYWFFIPLFCIYLSIPVLSLLKNNRRILWYMVGVTFLLVSCAPVICRVIGISWNNGINLPVMGGSLIYTVLGYLLSTEDLSKRKRIVIYILGIFGVLLRYFATWYLSARDGEINKMFFGYNDFYSVFLAMAVFVFFKYLNTNRITEKFPRFLKIIARISGCSFGIYLIHMIVYRNITNHIFTPDYWQSRIIGPFVLYFICLGIIMLLKQIPIVKKIVP